MPVTSKFIYAATAALSLISLHTNAQTFKMASGIQHSSYSSDDQTHISANTTSFRYFIKPVNLNPSQPFQELAFLQRVNRLGLDYTRLNFEDGSFAKTTATEPQFTGVFHDGNLVLGLHSKRWKKDLPLKAVPGSSYGQARSDAAVTYGYYVLPTTQVSLEARRQDLNYTPGPGRSAIASEQRRLTGVSAHSVLPLSEQQSVVLHVSYLAVKLEQEGQVLRKNTEIESRLQYYPAPNWYVGLGLLGNSGEDRRTVGITQTLQAGYAVTPQFNLSLVSSRFNVQNSDTGASHSSSALMANYRF